MSRSLHPSHLLFYLGEEDEDDVFNFNPVPATPKALENPKPRSKTPHNKFLSLETRDGHGGGTGSSGVAVTGDWPPRSSSTSSTSSLIQNSSPFSQQDVLKFPIESSHAYSYAHLSPNSLALRLNVLKRSLEILKDRPELFKSIKEEPDTEVSAAASPILAPRSPLFKPTDYPTPASTLRLIYKHPLANNSAESYTLHAPGAKLQSNASSAALAALFRPPLQRSGSLPITPQAKQIPSLSSLHQHATQTVAAVEQERQDLASPLLKAADVILSDDLKDIISILQLDNTFVTDNSEVAQNLHQISLASADQTKMKQDIIINKLMYALATPFVETSVMTPSLLSSEISATQTQLISPASALNLFGQNVHSPASQSNFHPTSTQSTTASARPFHAMSLGKHALPQSVFTVDVESPWSVKAANDLACLMFGILKNMIKSLTLMDLIAPQFRLFVSDKITLSIVNDSGSKGAIIFAGEIVAILRPGDGGFAWTSVWAKRRGNMIICMFDQIPCDAFDMVILKEDDNVTYKIDSVKEVAGKLVSHLNQTIVNEAVTSISESLSEVLKTRAGEHNDDEGAFENRDSERINDIRYFTLQLKGPKLKSSIENVPCAITSNPLEIDDTKHEIKVKIHTLPYIAGIFVINAVNFKILSCNNAIAKNLFGRSSQELDDESIDSIIPDFSAILQTGLDHITDSFSMVPGLVLPEHFFRKYSGILQRERFENCNILEEDLFFNSKGLKGIHRDGKPIWVDVQLRASTSETFVLWITYSRLAGRMGNGEIGDISDEIDKLSNSASSLSLYSNGERKNKCTGSTIGTNNDDIKPEKSRLISQEIRDKQVVNLPSQMNLFNQEAEMLELSSTEVSRKSSTRRTVGNYSSSGEPTLSNSLNLLNVVPPRESHSPPQITVSHVPRVSVKSDAEIIALENEMLEEKIKKSTEWPSSVGAKRRTKKFSEFNVLKEMGEGAYGKVVLAQHKDDPEYKIIIKCIDKERILVDTWVRDRKLGTIPSEINIMAFLNTEPHPNIMRIIDFFEDLKYYYLETPLFGDPPAIDLFDFIEIKKNMTELECKFIFKQVVLALYHLHKHGIVHRDIKDENVIVDENGIIKLIDFGSAGYAKLGPFDVFVGTIDYASPEVLRGERYGGKPQDIWALGILLYTMIYKENPFYNVDEIMEGDLRVPFVLSEGSENLIKKILVREVSERPTITDIIEDPWLSDI